MSEVTRILDHIRQGDPHAAEQLLPLVYEELRKLAAQKLAEVPLTSRGPMAIIRMAVGALAVLAGAAGAIITSLALGIR